MIHDPTTHVSVSTQPAALSTIGAASWFVPPRVDHEELLDMGQGTLDDVRQSLADLWSVARFLGGLRSLTVHLYPRLRALSSPATCLDLGTGSAQIPLAVTRWARRNQRLVRMLALDFSARHLAIAGECTHGSAGVRLVQGDALRLPFAPRSVDYVVSSLFLHHFTPEQIVELLQASARIARHGIIMSDLVRGWLPLVGFRLIRPVFRSAITHYDGEVSVRRAYTPREFRALAHAAGLPNARVVEHVPFRMTLVADL